MNIFMSGATGYIGSILMRQLIDQGHTVHVLYRSSKPENPGFSPSRMRLFQGDLLNLSSLEEAMKGCEVAYHLAAYARVWAPDPSTFHQINVVGTRNVLEAALKHGLDKVVVTSSAATLPSSENGKPVDEAAGKSTFETDYARSKFSAEEEAKSFSRKGLHTVIVNPPRVYGPGPLTESNAVTRLIKWYLEGKWRFLPGEGSYRGNYTFVEDVARGHRLAMEDGKSGERYILGGENLSLKELFGLVGELSGTSRKLWKIPLPLITAWAKMEKWKADTLHLKPLITPDWVDNYLQDSSLSSQKAVTELNYEITPAREGIAKTIHWLESDPGR